MQELDHPCKGTCFGWQQGYDKGRAFATATKAKLDFCRKIYTEAVAKECKCATNTAVNHDLVNRNLEMRSLLKKIQATCGHPDAVEGCRIILKQINELSFKLGES